MCPESMTAGQSLNMTVQVFDLVHDLSVQAILATQGKTPLIDTEVLFKNGEF